VALDADALDMSDPVRAARFLAFMEYPVEQVVAFLEGRDDFDGDPKEAAVRLVDAFRAYRLRNLTTSLVEEDEEAREDDARRAVAAEHDLSRSNRA
jgi:hypothetical protein